MSRIDPIRYLLFVDGGELAILWHKGGRSIYAPKPDAIPAGHDSGICIEVFSATGSPVQVARPAIADNELFYGCIFRSIGFDSGTGGIGTALLVDDPYHVVAGCQSCKVGIGLGRAIVELIAQGISAGIEYGDASIVGATDGRILSELNIVIGAGTAVGAVLL